MKHIESSDCLLEEGIGCGDVSCPAEPKIDSLPSFVYRPIEIGPLAAYFDIGFRRLARSGHRLSQGGSSASVLNPKRPLYLSDGFPLFAPEPGRSAQMSTWCF
jgi:hypothetical protein